MKKIIPMPEYTPPPKKDITELLSQEATEAAAHQNMRSYANAKLGEYRPFDEDDCTRPDLYKEKKSDDGE